MTERDAFHAIGRGVESHGLSLNPWKTMHDLAQLPVYADEYLTSLSPFDLTDLLIENEDRVPRNVIDECARRGDEMTEHLRRLHEIDYLWDPEGNTGLWWLRLHAAMILGLIPSEQAGLLLVQLMHRLSLEDEDQQDWLSGYWPALFKNKPDSVLPALRAICEDRGMDWYIRSNAIEPVIDAAFRRGGSDFDQALVWLVNMVADESEDWDFRLLAANTLLDHPRPEYRALLEDLADRQNGLGVMFSRNEVQQAYARSSSRQDIFANPWKFYEPDDISQRQIRWRNEEKEESRHRLNGTADYPDDFNDPYFFEETYIRPEPKVGRNDPCPCGSGKKYKKCCLN